MTHYNIIEASKDIDFIDFCAVKNTKRVRKFLQNRIEKLCNLAYSIIEEQARKLSIYTDEIRSDSKAFKIFMEKSFSFQDEDICSLEILIYLLNLEDTHPLKQESKSIGSLELEENSLFDCSLYIKSINNYLGMQTTKHEINWLYDEEVNNKKQRINEVKGIGGYEYFYYEAEEND